ncbi:MAG: bifunctional diguanylate cyclase/phosphodiesterase [Sphingomonas taxi]|uniref:Bifunctional diguanylate cyclase/phosphodiesterase n=1 Tax=Sphingomonas taxi TaxID=1549858 RepID=A0A2W5P810_9SPHN|nr:MAG: bifunctional diguanylate cyclase/phosphodiesterase [Sphingomonas taxi]
MWSAPHLFNEDERLAALAQYDLADTDTLVEIQDLVEITKHLFGVSIALVSVIERDRQSFKARVGLDVCETSRDVSFCAHALTLPPQELLVVLDATQDERFAGNPLVVGAPFVRFYAGVPLRAPDGHAIGTLCIINDRPRDAFPPAEQERLRTLAAVVLDRLEVRRLQASGRAGQSRFEQISATSPDGIMCADDTGTITFWNAAAERLFGFTAQEAVGSDIDIIVPPTMRGGHGRGLTRVAHGGAPRLVGTTVQLDAIRKDGTEFPIELSLSMWREHDLASFGAIFRDMTERRENEKRLFDLAHRDSLTGLPNRTVLMNRIADCAATERAAALLMIDLDGFKMVNDTLGHTAGDAVLKEVAERLSACVRAGDTVVRVAGDEFAVVMADRPEHHAIGTMADRLIERLAAPIPFQGELVHVGASIGIALYPEDGSHAEDLLSAADLAMYQAKAEGRDCRRFFVPKLREVAVHRRAFEGQIRTGLERGEFELFYQPQIRLEDDRMHSVEALLRWRHPVLGLLTPDQFLPSIESGLLAAEVGRWVIDRACSDAVLLRQHTPGLRVGINLFGAQFRTGHIGTDIVASLDRHGLPPSALELEITENIILRHDETMLTPLVQLRELGVGIAFDDFGTGFASLSMLKRFPLTRIKIDRSFIRDICNDAVDFTIVSTLVALTQNLGLESVAEGVETSEQLALVRACGCHVVQGYFFSKPLPLADLVGGAWPHPRMAA